MYNLIYIIYYIYSSVINYDSIKPKEIEESDSATKDKTQDDNIKK